MADEQKQLSAPFPTPPPFYQHFTKSNLSRLRQLRKEAAHSNGDTNGTDADIDILSLPPELRYLIPPSLPADNQYRTFGSSINLAAPDSTLQDAGIEQLYPSHPSVLASPAPHLLALTRSLLTTFLSLVGALAVNPVALYEERVDGLQTIVFNIHDLINRYRPHQARESLVLMMEERVERMREEMRRIEEAKGRVREVLGRLRETRAEQNVGEAVQESVSGEGAIAGVKTDEKRQRAAWAALAELHAP